MNIYDKNGNIRCVVQKFSYNDTFMGETFLTMDIESPNAIPFEIGDNCSYRGDIFTLNYVPSVEKTASADSKGDAFKYASVKMNSVADELTRCRMLDIVPDDMNVVWTGLPEFSFYAQTVNDLARRLQANLDSLYKDDKKWTVTTNIANLVDYNGVLCSISGKNPIDSVMSISDKSCMEILAECWNTFRVTYIIRGRTITIAPTPIEVGATFGYGKGQGLYGLQQQTKQDAQIITRLYVYGSTRNIGNHYYANLTGKGKGTIDSTVSSSETERLSFDAATGIIHDGTVNLTLGGVTHNIPMTTSLNVANAVRDHIYDLGTTEFSSWTLTKGDANSVVRVDFSLVGKYIYVKEGSSITIKFQGQTLYIQFAHEFSFSVSSFVSLISNRFVDANDSGGDVPQNWSVVNYVDGDTHLDFKCNTAGPRRNAEIRLNNITGLGVTLTLKEKGALYLDFKANSGGGRLENPTINANGTGLVASVFTSTYGLYPYGTGSNLYYFTLDFAYGTKYYKESTTQNGVTKYIVKFKAGDIEVNGYIELDDTHVVGIVYQSEPNSAAFYSAMQSATYIYITSGLYLDLLSSEYVSYNETISGNLAVNRLMLPDFPLVHNSPNDVYLDSPNISKYGIRQGYVIFDGSDASKPEIYPTIHQMTAKNVIDSGITLSLDSAEGTDMSVIRLDKIKGVIMPTDGTKDGNIPTSVDYNYNSWQNTFTIFLKDLGFDLSQGEGKYYYATSGNMSISMISGACAGREFKIDSIKRNTDLGYLRYELVCERSQDTNINKVYPYDSYPVSDGDEFVILNCRLPKVYVDANAQKLKDYGQAYLAKNDKTKYTYSPKVDEIWMDKNPTIANSIKAGDIFDFSDADLDLNVKSFIHTLSIKVGDKILPSYDITLDEEVESTTIQKIQNQINNISLATVTSTNIAGAQQATATLKVGNLSVGKIPCNTINGLADSPLYTDGTNVTSSVNITAPTFIGELQGNAATATKLQTARTIWGQSFDGSGNVDGTLYTTNGMIVGEQTYSLDGIPVHGVIMGHANYNSWNFGEYGGQYNFYLSTNPTANSSLIARIDKDNNYLSGSLGIGTVTPAYKLDVNGNMRVTSDIYADATVGTRNFASHTKGWRTDSNGNADFRNIYADELRVQAFTADISQALAGSDYLTKSVSKLSANFVVPTINSTVRIIVDDIEGMPATQCFTNGDYIRFRAFNRTSGLTIANVWGTVTLDTTFGTNGFSNGTQAYTFTCTQTTGAGLTVFKGSEVLDYGTSGSGLIARTTLDTNGSPYEQIATWKNDPSNGNNYTVHARLGNLNGIANCNGYGLYTDNGFFTGKITVGDLTKTNHYLDFSNGKLTVKGDVYLSSGDGVVGSNGVISAINLTRETATIQASKINLVGAVTIGAIDKSSVTPSALGAATPTDVTAAVNGIQVGGTNRAFDTAIPKSGRGDVNNINSRYGLYTLSKDLSGKQVVVSFDWSYTGGSVVKNEAHFFIQLNGPLYSGLCEVISLASTTTISGHNVSTTVLPDLPSDYGFYCRMDYADGTLTISNLKIEIGNKATDWTPAPEDVDASISTAQSTADAAGLAASNAQNSANTANSAISDMTSDDKITAIEKQAMKTEWDSIVSEKTKNDTQADNFGVSRTTYDSAYSTLSATIGTNLSSLTTTWDLGSGGGAALRSQFKAYYDARTDLLNAVSTRAKNLSGYAQSTANAAAVAASNAQTSANHAQSTADAAGLAASNAQTSANQTQSDATAAITRNNTMAVKLGYTNYDALASAAALGHTLIDGGMINTVLINAVAVVTNGLTANCITANMISSGAVTTDKLYAGAVTATTIASGAVTTDKLYVGAVTADKIAANTITGDNINANSVSAAIANVISLDASRITTGKLSADRIDAVSVVAKGLVAQTIDAQSATISNLNVVNATVNGYFHAEYSGGAFARIGDPTTSEILAIRADGLTGISVGVYGDNSTGLSITANRNSSKALDIHGSSYLITRQSTAPEGTWINGLSLCRVTITSGGDLGFGSLGWYQNGGYYMPNLIISKATSNISVYIPSNMPDGAVLIFRNAGDGTLNVSSRNFDDKFQWGKQWNNQYNPYVPVVPGYLMIMVYDKASHTWYSHGIS